jgi:hypothetical protein
LGEHVVGERLHVAVQQRERRCISQSRRIRRRVLVRTPESVVLVLDTGDSWVVVFVPREHHLVQLLRVA